MKRCLSVLVVDSDAAVRRVIDLTLRRAGYHVIAAADADRANDLLHQSQETPDVALLAMVLPGLSGPLYAARLQHQFPAVHIVFITGWLDSVLIEEAKKHGPVLFKPFHRHELLSAIGQDVTVSSS